MPVLGRRIVGLRAGWGRLLCALGLVALLAGCERRPSPEQWADAYDRGFWLGYQAAVDSVARIDRGGSEVCRLYDALGVRYVIATYSDVDSTLAEADTLRERPIAFVRVGPFPR